MATQDPIIGRNSNPNYGLVVRYGTTALCNYFERDANWDAHHNKIFNEYHAVAAASDKYSALEVLELEGIPVPSRALVAVSKRLCKNEIERGI